MWWWYGNWWWGVGMVIMMIVFWGGIIALIVWAVKRFSGGIGSNRRDPLDIAKERYARGEITKDQFEEIKKDLLLPR
jgi:putative membrane protein